MNFAACFFVGGVVMTFFSFECKLSNLRIMYNNLRKLETA